jgi:hypothetical protein
MSVLLVYPTHKNCRDVEKDYVAAGIDAATYPGRTTEDSEEMPQNCWNDDANRAEAMGLPVVKTICPGCASRAKCLACGYLGELTAVEKSTVVLCTHKRIEFSGLATLSSGRKYVSIHENPIDLLRPAVEICELDLIQVQQIANRIVSDPTFLDWFGDTLRIDDDGNRYHDDELAVRKDRQYQFCLHLVGIADALASDLAGAGITTEWKPATIMKCPTGIERTLFFATRVSKAMFQGQPWRFMLAAAAGELRSAAILVSKRFIKGGGQGNAFLAKSINGFKNNLPATGATTWFNDSTSTQDRLEMILGHTVHDKTPEARIECQRKRVQILRDITRGTSKRIFANILRGVLADRPQFQRVGVICLRPHIATARALGDDFDRRIVKLTYFGSGEDRSSNDWYGQCEIIIIAGTPRIPPAAIAAYLVQVGETSAACKEPEWGTIYWDGQTESGEALKVKSRGYHDEAWRRAHRDLVRAQLVQAIGRGRGILEIGCEVIVLSSEECGLTISDAGFGGINDTATKVIQAMRELSAQFSNKASLGKCALKASEIGIRCGIGRRQTQVALQLLERRGLTHRVRERSGWALVDRGMAHASADQRHDQASPQ